LVGDGDGDVGGCQRRRRSRGCAGVASIVGTFVL
jgi:hypothetical protein